MMAEKRTKRKLHSYTVEFKLKAVDFVKLGNSKEETARKYGVDAKRIREWCKDEDKLRGAYDIRNSKRRKLDGGGRPPLLETTEEELYGWIDYMRSQRLRVTRKMVQTKALELYGGEEDTFVASRGWLRNFFIRNKITLRRRTTVGQAIPDTVIPKLTLFILFVRSLILRQRYELSHIRRHG